MVVPIEDLIKPSRRKKKLRASRNLVPIVDAPRDYQPAMFPALAPTERHSSWTCLRAKQNYEAHMFEMHGVEVEGIDIDVIRQSSLGIEVWAVYQFGENSVSDDDDNNDRFPSDHCDTQLIEDPSAPLVVGGPASVVISGHRPGRRSMART